MTATATRPAMQVGDYWTDGRRLLCVLVVGEDVVECEDCKTFGLVNVRRAQMRHEIWRLVKGGG